MSAVQWAMPEGPPTTQVVDFARRAPSLYNTQPWRWCATGNRLELHADRTRQLRVADPVGRGLVMSCGAALSHARVAAAVLGWPARVLPGDDGDPDHLATLELRPGQATDEEHEAFRLLQLRRTDQRRFTTWPVPAEKLEPLARTVDRAEVSAVPVSTNVDRLRLELIARQAHQLARVTPGYAEEQLPLTVATDPSDNLRSADGALVLCAPDDGPRTWLLTGALLCRLWVRAMQDGLSVVPLSQPIEIEQARGSLRTLLGLQGEPQLVVRVGWQELGRSPLPPTSRRALAEVLDTGPRTKGSLRP